MKSPPYAVHAEKGLIGSLIARPDLLDEVRVILSAENAFFRDQYGRLFALMLELRDEHGRLDGDQLRRAAVERGILDARDARSAFDDLAAAAARPERAPEHARQIQEKAMLRRLIDVLSEIMYDASRTDDSFDVLIERARHKLAEL